MATTEIQSGTDHRLEFVVTDTAGTAVVDASSWSLSWMMKASVHLSDAQAALTKTTSSGIAVTGVYNADPDVNTQVVTVSIVDTDTDTIVPRLYLHELKRMDAGFEAVLATGRLSLIQSVHRQ
jgi:hypothetical protein